MNGKLYNKRNSSWEYHRIPKIYPEDEENLREMIEGHPEYDQKLIKKCWGDKLLDRGEIFEVHILMDLKGNQLCQVIKDQNGKVVKDKKFDPERRVLVNSKY